MNKKSTVVIFTFKPPIDSISEGAFLRVELEYLAKKFDKVLVIPEAQSQEIVTSSFPYELKMGLAEMLNATRSRFVAYALAIASSVYWRENFKQQTSPSLERVRTTFWFHSQGCRINEWFNRFCREENIDFSTTVFYTYWFGRVTFGLSLARSNNPSMTLVSRAHRVDLYENEKSPSYFPFREYTLRQMDALYLISRHGYDYISKKYPSFMTKYRVAKLGVRGGNAISKPSPAGEMRIVSCSQIRPVKRMNLMAEGIGAFAARNSELHIFWDHFGDGDSIQAQLPSNLIPKFWGNVSNDFIVDFYRTNPTDVFLNVSSSEGIPVSVMEAIASGLPVVAPSVGGLPEIVTPKNGVLLKPDPSPDEIANALKQFIPFSDEIVRMKTESYRMWHENYDADRNCDRFSSEIADLLNKHA